MSLTYRLARRDLRGTFRAFRIILLCLILGVGTLAAVQLVSRSVLFGIESNGRALLGGDLLLRQIYQPIPPEAQEWLRARGATLAETRELRAMLLTAAGDSALAEVKVIQPSYPLYGELRLDPPVELDATAIALDPALRDRLGVAVGDTLTVGGAQLRLVAVIANEPDRAGSLRFSMAPRAMLTPEALKATGLGQAGSMIYHELRISLPEGQLAQAVKDELSAAFPDNNWRIIDAANANPQLTRFISRLTLFLTLTGLTALLIGGIGIGNGLRAYFETRLRTIAILKAQGATVRFIARIYLWQVLFISMAGSLIGLLLGVGLAAAALPLLQDLLPTEATFQLTLPGLLYPLAFGLLTSVLFALWPLGQALATSALDLFRAAVDPFRPRPALSWIIAQVLSGLFLIVLALYSALDRSLALWFVLLAAGCFVGFWALGGMIAALAARLPAPRTPAFRLAQRNLGRLGNATSSTLVSLGLGLTVLVGMTLIELNLRQGITENLPDDAPAFFFLDIQPDQKEPLEAMLRALPGTREIAFSANLRGRIVSVNGVPAAQALVDQRERWLLNNDRGFTYIRDLPKHSTITEGQWWPADYSGPPIISIVDDVQRGFGIGVGAQVVINILGRDIEATVANVREVEWTNFTINYGISFAPGALEGAPHSWLATLVAEPGQEAAIQRALAQQFPNVSAVRVSEAIASFGAIMGGIADAVRLTALVAVVTGILVLAGSLAATRSQRIYDIVVLKVLGTPSRVLTGGFIYEFALLGLCAGGIALALGAFVSWAVLTAIMDLPWHFYLAPALYTLAAGLLLTVLIGWLMTGSVLRAPPALYLRND